MNIEESKKIIEKLSEGTMPSTGYLHMLHYENEASTIEKPYDTAYNFLYERNKNYMDQNGILFGGSKITYEEIHTHIDEYARALYKKGVRKGDVIALGLANTPETIYLSYGLNKIGAILTPINPTYNEYKMMRDLEIMRPKMFIGINDCYKTFKNASRGQNIDTIIFPAVQSYPNNMVQFLYGAKQFISGNAMLNINKSLKKIIQDGKDYNNVVYHEYEPGLISDIMFTGGSSGVHKGVDLEENALNSVIRSLDYVLPLKPGERFMGNMPAFIAFGKMSLHYCFCKSLEVELTPKAYPQDFVDELLRIEPAGVFGGPIHWEQLISNPKLKGEKSLSFLKLPVSGGEQLKRGSENAINYELKMHGSPTTIWNGLGMTEMWAPVAVKRGNLNGDGTIGTIIPFNNQKIMNLETGKECNYDEDGLLYVNGPGMMLGYHGNKEETDKVFMKDENGTIWYCSGDIVSMKKNGELIYKGRNKRIFVCGCDNVYPEQLETLLSEIPSIKEIVITPIPDEHLQFLPKAHIILKEKFDNELERENVKKEIEKIISSTLGKGIVPGYYKFYEGTFPKTDSNKIDARKVAEQDKEESIILELKK